jgi:hypothetical protein
MLLELAPVPVSDLDRAKAFYERIGFTVDVDVQPAGSVRIVQLTPPGSACSIVLSTGLPALADAVPGSVRGLHLVVADAAEARADLAGRGVPVGEIEAHDRASSTSRSAIRTAIRGCCRRCRGGRATSHPQGHPQGRSDPRCGRSWPRRSRFAVR